MCTVLLRFAPGTAWPLLLGAVRDEFADRAWDPPARHWNGPADHLLGGRDRVAEGTWLALDPAAPAVATLLNGPPLPVPPDGRRPSRGDLPLAALTGRPVPDGADLARYNGFHLMRATTQRIDVWSWDGREPAHRRLDPGDHVIVNAGVDADTPLVDRLLAAMEKVPSADPRPGRPTAAAWEGWVDLLGGGGIDPVDPRALIVRRTVAGRVYGSTSASLVALSPLGVRYDFTARPGGDEFWYEVPVRRGDHG
ncbi:MAG TPA: NRDE family protein [Planosporangium sp.]|nr:NRDE family protein [Planosporangium sp.]